MSMLQVWEMAGSGIGDDLRFATQRAKQLQPKTKSKKIQHQTALTVINVREPIAVVGYGCRLPGDATTASKLWDLLQAPRDLRTKIPSDRFNSDTFYHPSGANHGATNVQHAYLLSEDPRRFDPGFFAINPREAAEMDPQHRILREVVYESLEHAGLTIPQPRGSKTGIYVGLMTNDFGEMQLRDLETIPMYAATGTSRCILSHRVSHFFDWQDPSMTIDTACSSSLVAVHLAVQSLRSGETEMAVAGGSNLILGPETFITESKINMLSPSGRSQMWDHKANGYAQGEGLVCVVLKTLSAARRDNDRIECIIRETGVTQDGQTPGLTYFEAHGTGTPTGDPLEAEAISLAFFGQSNSPADISTSDSLLVGGIKTVIGHLEGGAGVASLLKGVLALKHQTIPPNLLFETINPTVARFTKHLQIPTTPTRWPSTSTPRVSINSFGFGGTNAHVILEALTDTSRKIMNGHATVTESALLAPIVTSAHSRPSLIHNIQALRDHLTAHPDTDLTDLAWTLANRRTAFTYRKAFVGATTTDLLTSMIDWLERANQTPPDQNPRHLHRPGRAMAHDGRPTPSNIPHLPRDHPHPRRLPALPPRRPPPPPFVGIGTLANQRELPPSFRLHRLPYMSEPLFHLMFAEAVIAGKPDSRRNPVLSLNMERGASLFLEEGENDPVWAKTPRFSHMGWVGGGVDGAGVEQSLKGMLAGVDGEGEVREVLTGALKERLSKILKLSVEAIDAQVPLPSIGMDSLIALQVRQWLQKELEVDVSMLRITNDSVADVVGDIVVQL
ncbi:ketoacyl-synt-domain-containing protein [Aspergillus ellipticus CBS 707.79]|uniref:Ketoacyl-synt-domain-containing protein n=1 Tax=Aspergillus ellipticus CBS 707.79 TaxID=1448320 RepID=A0A319D7F9_9EURO|nr:ketoacyl-synt-domain-containing protein [Aspergillus ellipticus CBS 707.79]